MAKENGEEKRMLLRFSERERMWAAVRLLLRLGYGGARGSAYRLATGEYLLWVQGLRGKYRYSVLLGMMEEYGQREENAAAVAYWQEYGECLWQEQSLRKMIEGEAV